MALTRSEIELIIKAKNQAQDALNGLNGQLKDVATHAATASAKTGGLGPELGNVSTRGGAASAAMGFFAGTIGVDVLRAVAGATRELATFAGELQDTKEKTGATAVGLQRISFAAKQSGIELGTVSQALTQMNDRLAGGNQSTVAALSKLNLDLAELRSLRPDEAMEAIASAIGKIPDPMVRTQVAMDLFGRTGAQLLPILNGQMKELGDRAERLGAVMSDETVAQWDQFQDSLTEVTAAGKGLIASAIGPLLPLVGDLTTTARDAVIGLGDLKNLFVTMVTAPRDVAKSIQEITTRAEGLRAISTILAPFVPGFLGMAASADQLKTKLQELPTVAGPALASLNRQKEELAARAFKVKIATDDEIKSIEKLSTSTRKSAGDVNELSRAERERARDLERMIEVQRDLFGRDDIARAELYLRAIGDVGETTKISGDKQREVNRVVLTAIDAYRRLGEEAPAAMIALGRATNEAAFAHENLKIKQLSVADALDQLGVKTEQLPLPSRSWALDWDGSLQRVEQGIKRIPTFWQAVVPDVSRVMATIQTGVNGSFAQMLLGAKGWKDGMLDIWETLKAGALNVLNEILSAFLNRFLKGMLGAMTGQRGAFASSFAGLFGGGGGTGGGGLGGLFGGGTSGGGGLGGLFGGGGGGFGSGGVGDQGPNLPGAGGIGDLARFGGGGILAATGIVQLLQAHGKIQNIIAGAQTGAGIGTMIAPGVGTAIGAGVGAVAGFIKSLFGGPSGAEVEARKVVEQFESILAAGLSAQQRLAAGGESWKMTVIAVRDAYAKLGMSEAQALADVEALWKSSRDGGTQTQAIVERIAAAMDKAAAAADGMGEHGADAAAAIEDVTESATSALLEMHKQVDKVEKGLIEAGEEGGDAGQEIRTWMDRARAGIGDLLRDLQDFKPPVIKVPYEYVPLNDRPTRSDEETAGFNVDIPEAAQGFYATGSRPALAVFGEGGQPETGGPASFFKRIFEELGVGGGGSGNGGVVMNVSFHVYGTLDQVTIERDVLPRLAEAVNGNKRGFRTTLRTGLGIA